MSEFDSWDDMIEASESDNFVGRARELQQIEEELQRDKPTKLIFYIFGQGGVGKTTLVKRIEDIAVDLEYLTATADERHLDVPTLLGTFATQLTAQGAILEDFTKALRTYRQKREELEADIEAPSGLASFLGSSVMRVGFMLGKEIPLLRQGLEYIDQKGLEQQAGEFTSFLAKKIGNKDEIALVREPDKILAPLFFSDLNKVAQNYPILLILENYEYTRDYIEPWLLRLREYKPSPNIRLLIASRTRPVLVGTVIVRACRNSCSTFLPLKKPTNF